MHRGQILVIVLTGFGSFGDRGRLATTGLLGDITTMVASARAEEPRHSNAQVDPSIETVAASSYVRRKRDGYFGPSHCHGSVCGRD